MKANLQHLGFGNGEESNRCFWVRSPYFGFHWHYHPELEITYVHRGEGVRLVGNHVENFQDGDMVLLGSNLPHTWISDDDFNLKKEDMEVVVLQFPPELFERFEGIPEFSKIEKLLKNARRGISFSKKVKTKAAEILMKAAEREGFGRFKLLLELFELLSNDETPKYLTSRDFVPTLNRLSEERLQTVCRYIHEHFTEPIPLAKAADLANMNTSAFCRFFKKMTGQSFVEYITDLRIGKACNLLIREPQKSISEISYAAGFNSQTLFNRSFLKKKGMTPRVFRGRFENE